MKKVKVLGVQFDVCTKDEALKRVTDLFETRGGESGKQIVTPNPEMLLTAEGNADFREILNRAFLSIPDGIGILWASTFQEMSRRSGKIGKWIKALLSLLSLAIYPRFCKRIFTERITGVDFMESICAIRRPYKTPIFLLGAQSGIAEKVKEILCARYPSLNIVGTFAGSPNEDDFPAIQARLAETGPEVLFVAYGAPAQEFWIHKHLKHLPSVKIAMGVGGAFDFIGGYRKRAPKLLQKLGLEWLYRLAQEPSRFKRIWDACVRFPRRVVGG